MKKLNTISWVLTVVMFFGCLGGGFIYDYMKQRPSVIDMNPEKMASFEIPKSDKTVEGSRANHMNTRHNIYIGEINNGWLIRYELQLAHPGKILVPELPTEPTWSYFGSGLWYNKNANRYKLIYFGTCKEQMAQLTLVSESKGALLTLDKNMGDIRYGGEPYTPSWRH